MSPSSQSLGVATELCCSQHADSELCTYSYDTTTPLELTRTYVEYLFDNYPLGSLEMRPINLTEPSVRPRSPSPFLHTDSLLVREQQVLDARSQSLERLFQSFPSRKFVLIGDTSSSSLLSAYPQIAQKYPQQLACIFIRNTSATDPDDKLPYSTSDFKNVNASQYFFYVQPTDLLNLDIAGGQCVNQSIPQARQPPPDLRRENADETFGLVERYFWRAGRPVPPLKNATCRRINRALGTVGRTFQIDFVASTASRSSRHTRV